jgi:DNA-nicking Smr family endonuclease
VLSVSPWLIRDRRVSKRRSKYEPDNDPAREFLDAVRDVEPLPDPGRVVHAPKPRTPLPFQRLEDDRQVLIDSLSDPAQVDLELEAGDALSFMRPGLSPQVLRRLRSSHWARQDQLDLHGSRSQEARGLLVEFLAQAVKRGYRCVLVVHGKGLGSKNREPVLKRKVAGWLAQRSEVLAFCQASPADGGSGAVVVLLHARGARLDAKGGEADSDLDD